MEFQVQKYLPGDETSIVELLQLVFNGWPKLDLSCTPLDHWKWKYEDNPLSTLKIITTINRDNNIVGCYHGVDLNVKVGEDVLPFNNGADVAVHPHYRRMGIYNKMNAAISLLRWTAGTKIIFWTTGNPILKKSLVKPGRRAFPQEVVHFIRIRDVDLHFKMSPSDNAWIKKVGYRIMNFIDNFSHVRSLSSIEKVKIKSVSTFDDRVNLFWDKIAGKYSFIVERRQDYLNWRYCDSRGGNYRVFIAEEEESLIGYCVVMINRYNKDYPRGYIVDLLKLPNRFDVSEALIQEAIDYFDGYDVNFIDCLAIRRSQQGISLRNCGFFDSRTKMFLVVSMKGLMKEEMEKYLRRLTMKKMHFVYGDID